VADGELCSQVLPAGPLVVLRTRWLRGFGLRLRIPFACVGRHRPGDARVHHAGGGGEDLSNRVCEPAELDGREGGGWHGPNDAAAAHSLTAAFGLSARSTAVSGRTVTDERARRMGDESSWGSASFGWVSSTVGTLEAAVVLVQPAAIPFQQDSDLSPVENTLFLTLGEEERDFMDAEQTTWSRGTAKWQPNALYVLPETCVLFTRIHPVGTFLQTGRPVSANAAGGGIYLGHSPSDFCGRHPPGGARNCSKAAGVSVFFSFFSFLSFFLERKQRRERERKKKKSSSSVPGCDCHSQLIFWRAVVRRRGRTANRRPSSDPSFHRETESSLPARPAAEQ